MERIFQKTLTLEERRKVTLGEVFTSYMTGEFIWLVAGVIILIQTFF